MLSSNSNKSIDLNNSNSSSNIDKNNTVSYLQDLYNDCRNKNNSINNSNSISKSNSISASSKSTMNNNILQNLSSNYSQSKPFKELYEETKKSLSKYEKLAESNRVKREQISSRNSDLSNRNDISRSTTGYDASNYSSRAVSNTSTVSAVSQITSDYEKLLSFTNSNSNNSNNTSRVSSGKSYNSEYSLDSRVAKGSLESPPLSPNTLSHSSSQNKSSNIDSALSMLMPRSSITKNLYNNTTSYIPTTAEKRKEILNEVTKEVEKQKETRDLTKLDRKSSVTHSTMGPPKMYKPQSKTAKTTVQSAAEIANVQALFLGKIKKPQDKLLASKLAAITSIFYFENLPDDLQYNISGYLTTNEFVDLSHSSKSMNARFTEAMNSRYLLYFGTYPDPSILRKITLKALNKTEDLSGTNVLGLFLMSSARGYLYFLNQIISAFTNSDSRYASAQSFPGGVNACIRDNVGALHLASQYGHSACVSLLLSTPGIDLNKQNKAGRTPLSLACEFGHIEIVNQLLDTLKVNANESMQADEIANLLDVNRPDHNLRTPLFWACSKGHIDIVNLLFKNNADPMAITDTNQTMLFAAAAGGFADILVILLQTNIDKDVQSSTGKTALYTAVEEGHLDAVSVLVKAKCDLTKETFRAKIPLYAAAEQGHVEICKFLLKYSRQADIFKLTSYGTTPMFIASKVNQNIKNMFCEFVSKKAKVSIKANGKKSVGDGSIQSSKPSFNAQSASIAENNKVEIPRFLEEVEQLQYVAHQQNQLKVADNQRKMRKERRDTVEVKLDSESKEVANESKREKRSEKSEAVHDDSSLAAVSSEPGFTLKPPSFLAREQQRQEVRLKQAMEKEQEEENKLRELEKQKRRQMKKKLKELKQLNEERQKKVFEGNNDSLSLIDSKEEVEVEKIEKREKKPPKQIQEKVIKVRLENEVREHDPIAEERLLKPKRIPNFIEDPLPSVERKHVDKAKLVERLYTVNYHPKEEIVEEAPAHTKLTLEQIYMGMGGGKKKQKKKRNASIKNNSLPEGVAIPIRNVGLGDDIPNVSRQPSHVSYNSQTYAPRTAINDFGSNPLEEYEFDFEKVITSSRRNVNYYDDELI